MKKALTFLTIAMLAVASQAVTVTWDSGVLQTPDGKANNNDRKVTASLYLIDSATYAGLDLSTADGQNAAINTYKAKTADASATSNKNGYANPTTTIPDANTGIANSQYAVIIYQYGTGDDAVYKIAKGQDYINSLGKQEKYASTELGSQTSGWTTGAVPEPTTVALLALGLAALGLKRKVA